MQGGIEKGKEQITETLLLKSLGPLWEQESFLEPTQKSANRTEKSSSVISNANPSATLCDASRPSLMFPYLSQWSSRSQTMVMADVHVNGLDLVLDSDPLLRSETLQSAQALVPNPSTSSGCHQPGSTIQHLDLSIARVAGRICDLLIIDRRLGFSQSQSESSLPLTTVLEPFGSSTNKHTLWGLVARLCLPIMSLAESWASNVCTCYLVASNISQFRLQSSYLVCPRESVGQSKGRVRAFQVEITLVTPFPLGHVYLLTPSNNVTGHPSTSN